MTKFVIALLMMFALALLAFSPAPFALPGDTPEDILASIMVNGGEMGCLEISGAPPGVLTASILLTLEERLDAATEAFIDARGSRTFMIADTLTDYKSRTDKDSRHGPQPVSPLLC